VVSDEQLDRLVTSAIAFANAQALAEGLVRDGKAMSAKVVETDRGLELQVVPVVYCAHVTCDISFDLES